VSENKREECKVKFVKDPEKGWKIVLNELSPACEVSLKQVSQNFGGQKLNLLNLRLANDSCKSL
jgi:hypothetical protein